MPGAKPASWWAALVRLWCLRAVADAPRGNPAVAGALLCVLWLAAWAGIDWWQRQPAPEFVVDGIALLAWYALGILCLAACVRWRSRPAPDFAAAVLLALGLTPVPLLLMGVGEYTLETRWFWGAACACALYGAAYLARGLRALTGRSQREAALVGVLFIGAFVWASDALNAIPDVWNPGDSAAALTEDVLAAREAALFEQADRIDDALEPIRRDDAPDPEGFFLGFAGVGDQKVFAQEIELAARVVGERFGTGDRQLSLINDERDLDSAPLASVSGLHYALKGLAARMDLDKDVLFLAISSHGSEDPAIAVANSQFPLQSLTPEELAQALKDAGIEWRVIVISACYAGGFIGALRDPRTVIITAAAADRTSFGCSNDSELTYFGEAFYGQALPRARSLRDAFDAAKRAVAERESREHVTASDPQAYFGEQIEAKLARMSGAARRAAGKVFLH